MKRDIVISIDLPHPPERVWAAVANAEPLGAWFMKNDFVASKGHRFTFRMAPQRGWDGLTHCEVVELDAPRRLAMTYRGEATGEKVIACAGVRSEVVKSTGKGIFASLDTQLSFTLEPSGTGTRLTLEHRGFEGFKLVVVSFVMGLGWKRSVLPRLRALLEKGAQG
jgi:uncharacterized protein YndB with AHSA1/START domain